MTDTTNVVIKVDSSQARAANKDVAALQKSVVGLTADLKKMTAASTAMNAASTTYIKKTLDAGATASLGQASSKDTGVSNAVTNATSGKTDSAAVKAGTESAFSTFSKGAVELVDKAFVDIFKNVDKGFKGFSEKMVAGFKQLLAEMLTNALVKPVITSMIGSLGLGSSGNASAGSPSITSILSSLGKSANTFFDLGNSSFFNTISASWNRSSGVLNSVGNVLSDGFDYIKSAASSFVSNGATASATAAQQAGAAAGNSLGANAGQYAATQAGLSAVSAFTYGLGGAIEGYMKAGVKGAVAGASGAVAGAYAGSYIGTAVFPGVGSAVGAAIGAVLGGMFGSSLFGGDWVTKDQGIQLGVSKGDFSADQFEYQKKKGGLFSSNKKRTRITALDPAMQTALDNTYDATEGSVLGLFAMLNVKLNDGVLDGLNMASTQISTKGKTADQIKADITDWFTKLADASVLAISDATQADTRGFTFETLTTFVKNLYGVNDVLKNLNVGLFQTSVQGGFMAEQLSLLAGGFDKLSSGAATYYDKFFSDTEKADNVLTAVSKEFKDLGVNLPSSRDAYRDLVESQDITTESGRSMLAKLITLAGDASSAYDILESRAKSARDAALAAQDAALAAATTSVNNAFSAVQRAVAAEQKNVTDAYNARVGSLNDMAATAQKSISDMTGISNALANALKALRGTSSDAVKMLRNQAQATLQAALATARSGGSISGVSGLDDALSTVSSNTTDLYSSLEDFNRDQGRTANVVAELNGLTNSQLSTEEQLLATVQEQIKSAKDQYDDEMARLDKQLDTAQKQLDALNGVDNSVISVAQAIANLGSAISAAAAVKSAVASGSIGASPVLNSGSGGAPSPNDLNSLYQSVLGRDADPAGMMYWAGQLGSGAQTADTIANAIRNDAIKNGEIPRYAAGGMFGGGLRLVGENGPELEVTGPSRIYSANQTASMLNGSGSADATVAELRQLRVEIHNDLSQIARYSEKTAYGIRQQNESGIALQEVAA
ncbi:DUF4214 domain-containing protein [Pseudomonas sp. Pseusp122]|uniref:DUF4214 domain-containing protein n=1 Tax=unclassified Pseudomonas TaxID=196821 RepID=UPI0039A4337F